MQPERYPHTLLHGHISGSLPQGRPRKKWIDNVKEDYNRLELTLTEAAGSTSMAEHRTQLGLPVSEDYIFVAKALSQVKSSETP